MRTRFVYQGNQHKYRHIVSGILTILRDEGIQGLFKVCFSCLFEGCRACYLVL